MHYSYSLLHTHPHLAVNEDDCDVVGITDGDAAVDDVRDTEPVRVADTDAEALLVADVVSVTDVVPEALRCTGDAKTDTHDDDDNNRCTEA